MSKNSHIARMLFRTTIIFISTIIFIQKFLIFFSWKLNLSRQKRERTEVDKAKTEVASEFESVAPLGG